MKSVFPLLALALTLTACNSSSSTLTGTDGAPVVNGGGGSGGGGQAPSTLDDQETAFVGLINAWRAQNGVAPLQVSVTLTAASQWMAQDMANGNYLDHTDSLGRDPGTRMFAFGYPNDVSDWGENVAAGNGDAQSTFSQWQNSPPHNANMLDPSYLAMGIGRAYNAGSTYGWYWCNDFGSVVDSVISVP